ncbi:flagellar biosynthetic protein FliR [Ancylobacter sp. FA202]|uniref:flagellar biosynthetic protein FliR n=1 Tax=Ancylobacter sp. FA202 TaxID=1111106 RepID=UPI00036FCB27|nr:flagellar biosynthetic protein FliR [Ancylobacter sp. FA202]
MNGSAEAPLIAAFLIFCRIGACFMLMPAFSSSRLPAKIRLFLALGLSYALTPLLGDEITRTVAGLSQAQLLLAIAGELATGGIIGLLARTFFLALQTLMTAAAQAVGLSTPSSMVSEEDGQMPEIATLMTLSATALLFATDQHWEILRAVVESYSRLPPAGPFVAGASLGLFVDRLSDTFLLGLRLASPFLVYSVVVNLAVGLINKLTPQIPVYFIAMPMVTAGGLLLLYVTVDDVLRMFVEAFTSWLAKG